MKLSVFLSLCKILGCPRLIIAIFSHTRKVEYSCVRMSFLFHSELSFWQVNENARLFCSHFACNQLFHFVSVYIAPTVRIDAEHIIYSILSLAQVGAACPPPFTRQTVGTLSRIRYSSLFSADE
jgi:hypothetical protein